ncbi:MAG TPA: YggS family pyridoxal phosphate-dependent enzyme [Chthonomonadales bacterium]|nr:YggS family pyridoxal phosphate-dependent enzyme [Chthonomonadales bacterium]
MSSIAENIARVRERIACAAERAGRRPDEIILVAATKRVEPVRIREAVDAGIHDFGENYYQEAREKMPLFGPEVRWHFIGHLQKNKAKYVVGRFVLIQSVDSEALARELGKRATAMGITQDVLIEVKIDPFSAEKQGVEPEVAIDLAGVVAAIPGLCLCGLMGMAPIVSDPREATPYFRRLRSLFERLPRAYRQILSMGMTADFEVAIAEGSTMVRVGTAIFGSRT